MIIINNQKRTCWGGKCEESGMVNCISFENYLKEKMKKCLLTARSTADMFLVFEPRDSLEHDTDHLPEC